jgi:SAM-dependent methyltransferase
VNTYSDRAVDLVVDLAQATAHDAVLDYACGVGEASFALASVVRKVDAVDEEPEALDEARRLSAELKVAGIDFALVDLYALPFADGTFSLIVCASALHRLPEPLAALRELSRVLSAGGRIIVCDAVVDEVDDRSFNELARLREPAHRRHFRHDEYLRLFAEGGLRVAEQRAARRTIDLDFWMQAAGVPAEKAELIRTRVQALPVDVQASMDIAFADRLVSFSYDVLAVRLER